MKMTSVALELREYRSSVASFVVLIAGAVIFLGVSRGTQFHQLAIGIVLSAVTLMVGLALVELCWRAGIRAAKRFDWVDGN
jgi:hypothetical protein